MILNPELATLSSALTAHLEAEIGEACTGSGMPDQLTIDGIAHAIEFLMGNGDETGTMIQSDYLKGLASQALVSLGHTGAARSLVLFGTGMLRPASWEVSGEKDMWILDLKEMTVRADASIELVFFAGLNMVIDSVSDLWDPTGGAGVLGLRHVCETARALLGDNCRKRAANDLGDEIIDACSVRLEKAAAARSWIECPDVINLDL